VQLIDAKCMGMLMQRAQGWQQFQMLVIIGQFRMAVLTF
jgi:hypothetical protein